MTLSSKVALGSARPYFVQVVLPTYTRFIEYYVGNEFGSGNDVRNANETAESLLHLGDRIHHDLGGSAGAFPNPTELRRSLFKRCQAYAIVSDVGLVAKHNSIDRGEGHLRSGDAITENVAIDRYEDTAGEYFRYRKLLEVELCNGKCADLGRLLFQSMIFWSTELVQMGVIPRAPSLSEPLPLFVARSCENRIRKFKNLGQVGEYLSFGQKIFFYRHDQRILTPMGPSDKLRATTNIEYTSDIRSSPFDPVDDSSRAALPL